MTIAPRMRDRARVARGESNNASHLTATTKHVDQPTHHTNTAPAGEEGGGNDRHMHPSTTTARTGEHGIVGGQQMLMGGSGGVSVIRRFNRAESRADTCRRGHRLAPLSRTLVQE